MTVQDLINILSAHVPTRQVVVNLNGLQLPIREAIDNEVVVLIDTFHD